MQILFALHFPRFRPYLENRGVGRNVRPEIRHRLHVLLLVSAIRDVLASIIMFVVLMLILEHGLFARLEARAFAWRRASSAQAGA
jgi:hypothetical protein